MILPQRSQRGGSEVRRGGAGRGHWVLKLYRVFLMGGAPILKIFVFFGVNNSFFIYFVSMLVKKKFQSVGYAYFSMISFLRDRMEEVL